MIDRKTVLLFLPLCVLGFASVSRADSVAPFGVASAYNLVALGTVDSHGNTVIAGNISTSADVTGRIAAANQVLTGTTVGSHLNSDPYGSLATFDVVSTNGFNSGEQFNVNSHGNVYAPGGNGSINFNGGGHRVTTGSSGIDFTSLRSTLDAESLYLGSLLSNGQVLKAGDPGFPNVNPSFTVLKGTSTLLNVFNITAAQFGQMLDIEAPVGSTIIINVSGVTDSSGGGGLYYNGNQNSGDSSADSDILFNFDDASSVTINEQFTASILAPFAILSGSAQMGGTFIAAQIGSTGEVHNDEFTGNLPVPPSAATPEPGGLVLLGTGLLGVAGLMFRKRSTNGMPLDRTAP